MHISTLSPPSPYEDLGLVTAVIASVEKDSLHEALEELETKATALGATGIYGLQVSHSQFQWNALTMVCGTAVKN